jgi:predicted component of type VI protein secretion system
MCAWQVEVYYRHDMEKSGALPGVIRYSGEWRARQATHKRQDYGKTIHVVTCQLKLGKHRDSTKKQACEKARVQHRQVHR